MAEKITPETEKHIKELIDRGLEVRAIARQLGISPKALFEARKRLGLPLGKRRIVTTELENRIKELTDEGMVAAEIAKQLGISDSACLNARKRLGLPLAKAYTSVTPEMEDRIKELWADGLGMKVEEIAEELHLHEATVEKRIRSMHLRKRADARLQARRTVVSVLAPLPKERKGQEILGQTSDDTFSWLAQVCCSDGGGATAMDEWRHCAAAYMQHCHSPKGPAAFGHRLQAIGAFLRHYLWGHRFLDPKRFFTLPRDMKLPPLLGPVGVAPYREKEHGITFATYACDWLDWVLVNRYSSDEEGPRPTPYPGHWMPLERPGYQRGQAKASTTDKHALPFTYIKKLRAMLVEGPNFKDWQWAQNATGSISGAMAGDWFRIDEKVIDKNDPDCVVRSQTRDIVNRQDHPMYPYDPKKAIHSVVGEETFWEMWSPVSAVALLVKLEMPFRTYQVRMLDSGEADLFCPEIDPEEEARFIVDEGAGADMRQAEGHPLFRWHLNEAREKLLDGLTHNDRVRVKGARGVFTKCQDPDIGEYIGFYVNTNKTADIGVSHEQRGYHIRWQNHSVHRWLIKLRNWQKKYNPIARPTLWTELELKHTGAAKSDLDLAATPPTCFLFRDASARGKSDVDDVRKPIPDGKMGELWGKLLDALEGKEARDGVRSAIPLRFVKTRAPTGAPSSLFYPLHALRVSIITALARGGMKLETLMHLAGHTRLVMTIYYIHQSAYLINEEMRKAAKNNAKDEEKQTQDWLMSLSYESLPRYVVANQDGLRAALPRNPKDRSVVQFERHLGGWCLMGGNVTPVAGSRQIGGCFNGGQMIGEEKTDKRHQNFNAVRPKACIEGRCRWFVTRPGFLLEIKARMDLLMTNLSLVQERRDQAEVAVRDLEAEFHRAEIAAENEKEALLRAGKSSEAAAVAISWTKADELDEARRWEDRAAQEAGEILIGIDNGAWLVDEIFALASNGAATTPPLLIAQGSPADVAQALAHADSDLLAAAKLSPDTEVHFVQTAPAEGPSPRPWAFEPASELQQLTGVSLNAAAYPELESDSYGPIVRRTQLLDQALASKGFSARFARLSPHQQMGLGNRLIQELAGPLGGDLAVAIKFLEGPEPLPPALQEVMQHAIASGAYEPVLLGELMAPMAKPTTKAIK